MNKEVSIKEFTDLIEKNQGIIFKVSGMYCKNSSCREDLFQDILLQIWSAFPSYDKKRKFTTWMYRIALNTAISQFRKEKGNILDFKSELPDQLIESNRREENENANILNQAILRLNGVEKAIIILYMDDYPYEEISEITGITVSNVGVKINRIKKKLQQYLKELGYGL